MKPADLLMSTAKLIIAAGFKMKEQARQEMAEEDLGGGIFDQDVKEMREAASKCNEPQQYDADEQATLDEQLAVFNTPPKRMKIYKSGTKLMDVQVVHTEAGSFASRAQLEVRAPPEQIVAFLMAHTMQYYNHNMESRDGEFEVAERRNDHHIVARIPVSLPAPITDREFVFESLWRKLGEDTFFVAQTSCKHDEFPLSNAFVRIIFSRNFKLTRLSPRLTKIEIVGMAKLGGSLPISLNHQITMTFMTTSQISMMQYFVSVRPADSINEGDATRLGHLLFFQLHKHRKNKDRLNEKILDMIRTMDVLRSAQAKYR
jgi:hypothetical protein